MNRARKSLYPKDKVFIKLYIDLENKEKLFTDDNNKKNTRLPFIHLLLNRKKVQIVWDYIALKHRLNYWMVIL